MKQIDIFIGNGSCDARCQHCAGVQHRTKEGTLLEENHLKNLFYTYMIDAINLGASCLTLSGSGEPTYTPDEVTKILEISQIAQFDSKRFFHEIRLYTNGIRIGGNHVFAKEYLSLWRTLGMSTVIVSLHGSSHATNAAIYGVNEYPSITQLRTIIKQQGLTPIANIIVTKINSGTLELFAEMVSSILESGFAGIKARLIRNPTTNEVDRRNIPPIEVLDQIRDWCMRDDASTQIELKFSMDIYSTCSGKKIYTHEGCEITPWAK